MVLIFFYYRGNSLKNSKCKKDKIIPFVFYLKICIQLKSKKCTFDKSNTCKNINNQQNVGSTILYTHKELSDLINHNE
jgi:hypothetical protein